MNDSQVLKPELDLFDSFILQLRQRFEGLDGAGRWKLLGSLRRMTGLQVLKKGFDGKQARNIRDKLGLTRKEVCKKFVGMNEVTLYKYEAGLLTPNPKANLAKKYLAWLKGNGFHDPEENPGSDKLSPS